MKKQRFPTHNDYFNNMPSLNSILMNHTKHHFCSGHFTSLESKGDLLDETFPEDYETKIPDISEGQHHG
jgi:hypothetical protein